METHITVASQSGRTETASQRRTIRVISILLTVNLILAILLVLWPYFVSKPLGEAEYNLTHTTGLSPKDYWPFDWQGLGLFLHDFSMPFAFLTGPIALVLGITYIAALLPGWEYMRQWEKNTHTWLVIGNVLLLLLLLVRGSAIIGYLLD